jgi:cbb3-type cytochrome oxidase cytochrome c subunit
VTLKKNGLEWCSYLLGSHAIFQDMHDRPLLFGSKRMSKDLFPQGNQVDKELVSKMVCQAGDFGGV